jgi:hypothetical protein
LKVLFPSGAMSTCAWSDRNRILEWNPQIFGWILSNPVCSI